jgi:hypothetical protein
MAWLTMASISASIAEFRKLSQHVQGRALLKALVGRFPRDAFNRVNSLLEPYNAIAPDGLAVGLPEAERRDAVKFRLVFPCLCLMNGEYTASTRNDFNEITLEGMTQAAGVISAIKVDRTVVDAPRFLHSQLQISERHKICV